MSPDLNLYSDKSRSRHSSTACDSSSLVELTFAGEIDLPSSRFDDEIFQIR